MYIDATVVSTPRSRTVTAQHLSGPPVTSATLICAWDIDGAARFTLGVSCRRWLDRHPGGLAANVTRQAKFLGSYVNLLQIEHPILALHEVQGQVCLPPQQRLSIPLEHSPMSQ